MKYQSQPLSSSLVTWQPSTWPTVPNEFTSDFCKIFKKIIDESIILEINNTIGTPPNIDHKGHVIALAILSGIDVVSSYVYNNIESEVCVECSRSDQLKPRYIKYIEEFYPDEYKNIANEIYKLYRNPITHSWNLFGASMTPDDKPPTKNGKTINLGILHFFNAYQKSIDNLFEKLENDSDIQKAVLARYKTLRQSAVKSNI